MICNYMQVSQLVGLPSDGVMVCGDSGNDIELFAVPNARGCMVSNAHLELKRWCDSHASPNLYQVGNRLHFSFPPVELSA